jgi:DNA-binding NarL/FixJ family response regulator
MSELKIMIADPQDFTRLGICSILSLYYNGRVSFDSVSTKEDLIAKLKTEEYHAIILDFDLLDFKNMGEVTLLRSLAPGVALLIVSENQSSEDILRLVEGGITNYILKSSSETELTEAISAALANRKYFSSEVLDILFEQKNSGKALSTQGKLTLAETEIVRMIAQGLTTKEIALARHLSFHTIITHRKNIFRKLNISNSSELLMYAIRNGVVDSGEYYI